MKKITLLLILLMSSLIGFSQLNVSTDYETAQLFDFVTHPNSGVGQITLTSTQSVNGSPANLVVTGLSGVTYTPPAGFLGTDTFTFTFGPSVPVYTATVTVNCIAPLANTVSAASSINGLNIDFTITAPTGVTVAYTTSAGSGTATNGQVISVPTLALTSGTESIVLDSAYITSDSGCVTLLGAGTHTFSKLYCNAPVAGDISANSTQVGTDVVFTFSAPVGVTVTYEGHANGTAVNGDTVTVAQSVLTSGTSSIILERAALTADAGCSTVLGGFGNLYSQAYCNAPVAGDISASSTQVGTDVVFTISAPVGVTVAYSGDVNGTAVNGDTVTIAQSVLTSGSASITLDSSYLTADAGCSTVLGGVGNTYSQLYCNAPVAGDISASSAQVGTDVVFTISAPVGVTVTYSGDAGGTAVNGDTVTIPQLVLTSDISSITLDGVALTSDIGCSTVLGGVGNTYNQAYCNAPVAGDISASSAQVGTDVVFTISAPVGVTVTYSGDTNGTAINGGTVTVSQLAFTSGSSSITLDSAALTSDAGCSTVLGGIGNTYTQEYCNAPTLADVSAIPSVSGDDVIFTISAPAGVTVDVTSVQGSINAINGDIITFVDANLIHSIDFSVTLTATYLTADNSCNTDIDPDSVITFTVPRSRHPLAIDDVHTLDQTKSRSMRPLERGVNDSDPNGLPLRIKTINGEAVVGGVQTILVPNGAILIDELDIMRFKSDNSFTGLIQFPYEIINTDDYEDDGVVFVTVDPLPNQPTMPTAVNDMYAMGQGTSLEVKPLSKGTDDSDPNNLELVVTSIDGIAVTGNGQTIAVTDGVVEVLDALLSEFNFTPNSSFSGSTSFTYIITNLVDDTATASVTIVVDPLSESPADPTATDDVYTMSQGTTINITPLTKGEDDSDPNDLDLSIVSINSELLTGGVQSITVTNGQVNIDINGEITFTPDVLFTDGTIMFPYIITNTLNLTDSAIETITVNPVNLNVGAPTAIDDSYTMDQGESIVIRPLTKGVNDSDPDDLDLSIFSIAGEEVDYNTLPQNIDVELAGNVIGVVTIDTDEITFTPSATTTGTVTFPYVIKNTIDESATANQIIEVNAVASAGGPTATNDSYSMDQGDDITIRPLTKGVNDSDPNRLDLSIFSIAGEEVDYNALPQNIDVELAGNVIGVVTIDLNEIIFTPAISTTGTVTFPYVIKNTIDESATANQIIEVNAIASAGGPIAIDDNYTMDQGETLLIRPLTKGVNDSDPGRLDLSIFSIAGEEIDYNALPQTVDIEVAGNVVGSVEVSLDQMTFTPVVSNTGTVLFPYVIRNTINESATANQTIEIIPVDSNNGSGPSSDNPVAVDDTYAMKQGQSRIIKPLTRHYDDNDPNGLALVITHIGGEEVDGGAQVIDITDATISIDANDVITFIPDPNISGTISFSYVIENINNLTATGMVNMIVDAVNTNLAAPNAIDDFYTIPLNTVKKIEPLTYGTGDNDPNGESLTLAYINGEEVSGNNQTIDVPNGMLQINNENDITFIPNKDYIGFAMFSYEIINAIGISDTGLQTIEVVQSSALSTDNFLFSDKDFVVYPNPSLGDVNVRINSNLTANATITLSDVTGKTIYISNSELKQGENTLDFNFNVSPGIMFLRITSNNQSVTKKLLFK